MGIGSKPGSPAAGEDASAPVTAAKAPCCWCANYTKEINVESRGRYYRVYKADGSQHNYHIPRRFKLMAPVKSGTKITVRVRFRVVAKSGVTKDDVTLAKSKLKAGVAKHWNGKFKLEIIDPQCGKKTLPIVYQIVWVTGKQHYTINVHGTYPREGVTGFVMDVQKSTSDWVYAHEFGHCVGLPDEYSYTTDTESVRYIKPSGGLGAAISAPPDGKDKKAKDATIMAAYDNTRTLKRHAWNIAIEVQELLTAKLGREIRCVVR